MKEFNFALAWNCVIAPFFKEQISSELKEDTNIASSILKDSLQCEEPNEIGKYLVHNQEVYNIFNKYDSEILSKFSYVCYFMGHWFPYYKGNEHTVNEMYGFLLDSNFLTGSYWKIANIVDQILTERLNLNKNYRCFAGNPHYHYKVTNGQLTITFSSNREFTSNPVCWANKLPNISLKNIEDQISELSKKEFVDFCFDSYYYTEY